MDSVFEAVLPPEIAYNPQALEGFLQKNAAQKGWTGMQLKRRSIDARGRQIKVNITAQGYSGPSAPPAWTWRKADLPYVANRPEVAVIGAGPAGLFAALRLIELNLKPVVIERGKDVRNRRRDLAAINKDHLVNPESNYCFGEGGAGTYSDGKLYTRSKKRGSVQRILEILTEHGASTEILADAHPHIGTNKLPKLVQDLRETVIEHGGQIYFDTRLDDLQYDASGVTRISLNNGQTLPVQALILATGHSARDIFELLHRRNILIEAKPFALGVRIEHPQSIIDSIQYHCADRGDWLPAASYSLVQQVNYQGRDKGVFSFCMCPGGFIVPAATKPGELVVNGMSPSRRDSRFANSGMVVEIDGENWGAFTSQGPLAAMQFQAMVEQAAWAAGGRTQTAPAQRMVDFVNGKLSPSLPETSYQPGLASVQLSEVLPPAVGQRLKTAFQAFGKKMKGYLTNEAVLVGVESRTSSPVRIPRDDQSLMHPQVAGLFPCGEGAGYAGGIVSAAMDGERCAEAAAAFVLKTAIHTAG